MFWGEGWNKGAAFSFRLGDQMTGVREELFNERRAMI